MKHIETIEHHLKATQFMERINVEKAERSTAQREKDRFRNAARLNHEEAEEIQTDLDNARRGRSTVR